MNVWFDRAMSGVLTAAAVVVAAVAASRVLGGPDAPQTQRVRVDGWRDVAMKALPEPPDADKVSIVEFVDLECTACRVYQFGTLARVSSQLRDSVSLRYLHYPLPNHPLALPLARGAECARMEGRFSQFVSAVYAKQDSIKSRAIARFATDAGVKDLRAFGACITSPDSLPSVEEGLAIGDRLGVRGTPTIMVNGCLFKTPPSDTLLLRIVRKLYADPEASCR